jgi:hypothetical protein
MYRNSIPPIKDEYNFTPSAQPPPSSGAIPNMPHAQPDAMGATETAPAPDDDINILENPSDAPSRAEIKSKIAEYKTEIITGVNPYMRFGEFKAKFEIFLKELFACSDPLDYYPTNLLWKRCYNYAVQGFFKATVAATIRDNIIGELPAEQYYARLEHQAELVRPQMWEYLNLEFFEKWNVIPNDLTKIAEYMLKLHRHFRNANYFNATRTWHLRHSGSLAICSKVINLAQRNYSKLNEIRDSLLQIDDQDNLGFDTLIDTLLDLRTIVMGITTAEQGVNILLQKYTSLAVTFPIK